MDPSEELAHKGRVRSTPAVDDVAAPSMPKIRASIGVTGHRAQHPLYSVNAEQIEAVLADLFELIDQATKDAPLLLGSDTLAPTRLHTLLVDGTDQAAAKMALAKNWELVSPLPFGARLNLAINAKPENAADARAILKGELARDSATLRRAEAIDLVARQARLFELADQDEKIETIYLAKLGAPGDFAKAQAFALESAQRALLAGRILIEQSDLLIAVWDGKSSADIGGAGHTLATALDLGAPVIWINPEDPENWRILHAPESLALPPSEAAKNNREFEVSSIIKEVIYPEEARQTDQSTAHRGLAALTREKWHNRSSRLVHAYRRIEALFGGGEARFRSLVQTYEKPDNIATGTGAAFLEAVDNLPGADPEIADKIHNNALKNFAWADGISARLSDHYRAGMVVNFLLSALAIVGGILYLPLVSPEQKWGFALFEFVLLLGIVIITWRG
ncbi:MAG: hypothetical protein WBM39_08160, partial [Parasphingorhabdus sp.]